MKIGYKTTATAIAASRATAAFKAPVLVARALIRALTPPLFVNGARFFNIAILVRFVLIVPIPVWTGRNVDKLVEEHFTHVPCASIVLKQVDSPPEQPMCRPHSAIATKICWVIADVYHSLRGCADYLIILRVAFQTPAQFVQAIPGIELSARLTPVLGGATFLSIWVYEDRGSRSAVKGV